MHIITDAAKAREALESFVRRLREGCEPLTVLLRAPQGWREEEVFWNPALRLWAAWRHTQARDAVLLGLSEPAPGVRLTPCATLVFPRAGFSAREQGFFVRFGGDVLAAWRLKGGSAGDSLAAFLEQHGHGPTLHEVQGPDGPRFQALILCSVASPDAGFHLRRFASALNDHARWDALGLDEAAPRILFGPKAQAAPRTGETRESPLRRAIVRSLRDQLAKAIDLRKLRHKLGVAPGSDIVLASGEGAVLAVLQVRDSLDPEALHGAVGELVLSRRTLRAAKCLAVPGPLGPYFTQVLYSHDIHVVPYTLTPELAAVLDVEAVFRAITHAG